MSLFLFALIICISYSVVILTIFLCVPLKQKHPPTRQTNSTLLRTSSSISLHISFPNFIFCLYFILHSALVFTLPTSFFLWIFIFIFDFFLLVFSLIPPITSSHPSTRRFLTSLILNASLRSDDIWLYFSTNISIILPQSFSSKYFPFSSEASFSTFAPRSLLFDNGKRKHVSVGKEMKCEDQL